VGAPEGQLIHVEMRRRGSVRAASEAVPIRDLTLTTAWRVWSSCFLTRTTSSTQCRRCESLNKKVLNLFGLTLFVLTYWNILSTTIVVLLRGVLLGHTSNNVYWDILRILSIWTYFEYA
jgi:hypothetical protein